MVSERLVVGLTAVLGAMLYYVLACLYITQGGPKVSYHDIIN